jgi:Zn-dependent protease with chaperone function
MISTDFIHPEDAKALKTLEAIPGLKLVIRKFLELGYERMYYGMNMASQIRLSPTQLPEIYKHLPPICEKLGMEVPEFYLEMNPLPNACTYGDTKIFIRVTSGLVEMMNDDELDAVLAHECGHILCRHTLYRSIATTLFNEGLRFGLLDDIAEPLKIALYYWMRKSELSCDRVSALVTSPETVMRVMARLSGGPKSLTAGVNFKEWAEQADKYDEIYNDGLWNRSLMIYNTMLMSHPFAAVRVREILKWCDTDQFVNIKSSLPGTNGARCPKCGHIVDPSWAFCEYCGQKL